MVTPNGSTLAHAGLFGAGALAALRSARWTLRRRDRQGARAFVLFLSVVAAWNVTILLEVIGPVALVRALHPIEQSFQVLTPVVWWYFAVVYTGRRRWLDRPIVRAALVALVAGMLAFESLPPLAEVTYGPATVVERPFPFVAWADTAITDAVELVGLSFAAVGSALVLASLGTTDYARPWQVGVVLVTTAGTIAIELFESGLPGTVPGVDYAAVAVAVVGASYVAALYRYDLFGYTPVDTSDVIDGITAPVVVLNPERRVVEFNPSARSVFPGLEHGAPADDVLPEPVREAAPLAGPRESETELTMVVDGRERTYRLYAAPLDSFGADRGLSLTLRDITERRHQQAELDLLTQILTRAMRHNVRNEVDVVRANARELAGELEGRRREHAMAAVDAADDLAAISDKTRTLRDVVHDRGRRATVELSRRLRDAVADVRSRFPSTTVELDCPPEASLRTNPDVDAALRNLIENAVEHTRDGATVRVRLERTDEGAVVEVADDGPGIPDGELAVLERGRETVLEHGSGVGLWIVNLVVEDTPGSIRYDVEDGTTITLELRDAAAGRPHGPATPGSGDGHSGDGFAESGADAADDGPGRDPGGVAGDDHTETDL